MTQWYGRLLVACCPTMPLLLLLLLLLPQGKRHQQNLGRRAAREMRDAPASIAPARTRIEPRKTIKIGRPGYKVTKQMDQDSKQVPPPPRSPQRTPDARRL